MNKTNHTEKRRRLSANAVALIVLAATVLIVAGITLFAILTQSDEITVYIDFTADGKQLYAGEVTVEKSSPTVIDAVARLAEQEKMSVTYDSEDTPLTVRDVDSYTERTSGGLSYFWEFGINDISVYDIEGRAGVYTIHDGDSIHWIYSSIPSTSPVYGDETVY